MPTDTPEPLSDAVPKYSAREIADWRKKHVPVILRGPEPQKHCGFDDAPWPCFTIAALNGWDALLAAREELEQAKADIMELMAEKLPDGTTLHRMVTTYPKMHQRMLGDADNEIAKLRQRAETAEADCVALREMAAGFDCRCDMRFIRECADCGAPLEAVPEHRYLNSDQWDAVKAGDFFCTGTCTSDAPSGKKYWRYRHLRQYVHGDVCPRCAALANPNPGAGLLEKHHAESATLAVLLGQSHAELEQARTRIAEMEARP